MADPVGSTGKIPKPRCIDPLKCYHPTPKLPSDYTVEIVTENQVDLNDNFVNRSVTFKCTKESKYILTANQTCPLNFTYKITSNVIYHDSI